MALTLSWRVPLRSLVSTVDVKESVSRASLSLSIWPVLSTPEEVSSTYSKSARSVAASGMSTPCEESYWKNSFMALTSKRCSYSESLLVNPPSTWTKTGASPAASVLASSVLRMAMASRAS